MDGPEFKSSFLAVAYAVLAREGRPMHPQEIVDSALRDKLLPDTFSGATPVQTLKSKLSVHIRRHKQDSVFVRTRPGVFFLREALGERREYVASPQVRSFSGEDVVAVEASYVERQAPEQGITRADWGEIASLLDGDHLHLVERMEAEGREDVRQVLTYVIVEHDGQVLSFVRGTFNRVEDELKGLECIGFGGHVSSADFNLFSRGGLDISAAAARELREELRLPRHELARLETDPPVEVLGILNDESSPTGRRHIAIVMRYRLGERGWSEPARNEKSIRQLQWRNVEGAGVDLLRCEYWTQLCLREFYPSMSASSRYVVRRKGRRSGSRRPAVLMFGLIGSGKTAASRVLVEEFGYVEVNSGQVVAEMLGAPPVSATGRAEFQHQALELVETTAGQRALGRELSRAVRSAPGDSVVLDGIRFKATADEVRADLSRDMDVVAIYVHTPADIAYEFYRSREDPDISPRGFYELREAAVEREVESLMRGADVVLYNWFGFDGYVRVVRDLMESLGVQGGAS